MKKFLALVLTLAMLFSLVACGSTPPSTESQTADPTETPSAVAPTPTPAATPTLAPTPEPTPAPTDTQGFDVDKNLFTVELTIPADFVAEGTTQESLDEAVSKSGYKSAVLNSDGSVTYIMTKEQHKAIMDELKLTLDEALAELVTSGDYPSFVDIKANDDYTSFDVVLSSDTVGLMESFSVLVFYMYGGMYNAFNGSDIDNISVSFINQATGAVIKTANSKDAG